MGTRITTKTSSPRRPTSKDSRSVNKRRADTYTKTAKTAPKKDKALSSAIDLAIEIHRKALKELERY